MAEFRTVGQADEVPDGGVKRVELDDGLAIAIFNVGGQLYVIEDRCTHEDTPLSTGWVDDDDCAVNCPLHGARFSLQTGRALSLPAVFPVRTFEVRTAAGEIQVKLTD